MVSSLINFDKCEIVPVALNGAMDKVCVDYKGDLYILKFNSPGSKATVSEYIASKLASRLGIECQEVLLGTYNGRDCCALKYLCSEGQSIHSYHSVNDSSYGSGVEDVSDIRYDLENIDYVLRNYRNINLDVNLRLMYFQQMCYFDAVIGNFDRHWGNWGFIGTSKHYSPCPLFDNGSSLFPTRTDEVVESVLNDREELNKRIYGFPTSSIKTGSKKTDYVSLISQLRERYGDVVLRSFYFKMKNVDLVDLICNDNVLNEVLSYKEKIFMILVMKERFNKLIKEVVECEN